MSNQVKIKIYYQIDSESNDVVVSINNFVGHLSQLIHFRESFDYSCYKFGGAHFKSAKWKTIIADDDLHQAYPKVVTLANDFEELELTWIELNNIIQEGISYLKNNSGS